VQQVYAMAVEHVREWLSEAIKEAGQTLVSTRLAIRELLAAIPESREAS
jgi:hypothetical protein